MSDTGRRCAGILLALGVMLGAGCAATRPATVDRTGGLSLELLDRPESNAAALYRVERDGTLRFGGGLDALNEHFSWSGPLTDEELARLRELDATYRWLEVEPLVTDRSSPRRMSLSVRRGGKYRRYRIEGDCDAITPLRELLQTASQRRLDAYLQRLPKPGLQQER